MEFKVFKMNNCDIVISTLNKNETNEWYKKECDYNAHEQPIWKVEEISVENGFWKELQIDDYRDTFDMMREGEEKIFRKTDGSIFVWLLYKEIIASQIEAIDNEPFIV